jgi:radical SAM/Cys-rich protein
MSDFVEAVRDVDPSATRAVRIDTLMLNIGLRCNMECSHCHQSCSPERHEMMSRATIDTAIAIAGDIRPVLIDVTGGAPELHPDLPYLVEEFSAMGLKIQVRTNLTALLEPEAERLIDLYVRHGVRILASVPGTSAEEIAPQRGQVYESMVEALGLLAEAGYGSDSRLRLDIAVNAVNAELQQACEHEARFRSALREGAGIEFRDLVDITNVPVGRFGEALRRDGQLGTYRQDLRDAFNPDTVPELACRYTLDIAWDGALHDCDFNGGAGLGVAAGVPRHISEFDIEAVSRRPIRFAEHCFACTAQAGSG